MMKLASLVGFVWANSAVACSDTGQPLISSDTGAPLVELDLENIPLAQPFSIEIRVCDDAQIQSITVDAIMPAHQHGMNYTPTILALNDGVFHVDGMLFHMPGVWEIQVGLIQDTGVTHYTQTIALK